jgi:hypothetical protein
MFSQIAGRTETKKLFFFCLKHKTMFAKHCCFVLSRLDQLSNDHIKVTFELATDVDFWSKIRWLTALDSITLQIAT